MSCVARQSQRAVLKLPLGQATSINRCLAVDGCSMRLVDKAVQGARDGSVDRGCLSDSDKRYKCTANS